MELGCVTNNINFTAKKLPIKVDEKLLRGEAVTSPLKLYRLKQQGVTKIIDLRNSAFVERPLEKFFCKLFGIKYENHKYPFRLKTLPQSDFFESVNDSIVKNKGKTYIHCQYGKRRTGICVAIYEKLHTDKKSDEIIDNMVHIGFKEVEQKSDTKKARHVKSMLLDLLKKYFPNQLGRFS